jgi:bifunctional non-homologous end joining protein LigD
MSILKEYTRKRDFTRTPEPSGLRPPPPSEEPKFVVQKHAASRLHYDFRLEMAGVLKSWAVPKGIPFSRGDKRLAIQVEDHPLDYATFEGTIAEGNYGAGTVMIWDQGSYETPDGPPLRGLAEGKLRLRLHGSKLEGEWTLVRTPRQKDDTKTEWLLIKTGESAPAVPPAHDDESAVTRRSMAHIGKDPDPQWDPTYRPARREIAQASATQPPDEPVFQPPMKPRLVERLPQGDEWVYEVKFDGFRAIGIKNGPEVHLLSRNELDLGGRFPEAPAALAQLPCQSAVVDGEIVAVGESGNFDFQLLQNAGNTRPAILVYLFDLLHLDGHDLTGLPLIERKQRLQDLMAGLPPDSCLKFSASLKAEPDRLAEEVKRRGLEGIVAKKAISRYESGLRSGAWVKWKSLNSQEFVIGGFTPPRGGRRHFGALVVGYRENGKLLCAARVGTGFSDALLKSLLERLKPLARQECPFANLPMTRSGPFGQGLTAADLRACTWVEPVLVCEVQFAEWTREGQLRQPSFKGLRPDKSAAEVIRERPAPVPKEETKKDEKPPPARSAKAARSPRLAPMTHPDKVLFPDDGITKRELADYYARIAPRMLPYMRGRPVAMERYPDGIAAGGFYHKDAPAHFPAWIPRVRVPKDNGEMVAHPVCETAAALVYLASQACITPHTWLSRRDKLHFPDQMVFDLDPSGQDYSALCETAYLIQGLLVKLGLAPYVKTTGSRGLHIVVPLDRKADFEAVRDFARDLAGVAASLDPGRLTVEVRKNKRKGRLFLDTTRNAFGQTIAPPYAVRPRPGAPVSTPLAWDELKDCAGLSERFRLRNVFARLERTPDPWKGMPRKARSLRGPRRTLDTWLKAMKDRTAEPEGNPQPV